MKASEKIKSKIKEWEGCRLTAYRCPAGLLTIGYGHTGKDVCQGLTINKATADYLFEKDIAEFETQLDRALKEDKVPALTQGQYDALLSIAYNIGITKLRGQSTLWRKLRANPSDSTIPAEFNRWVYGGGKVLPGLVKRRQQESEIYQS